MRRAGDRFPAKGVLGPDKRLGVGTRDIYRRIRESIPFIEADEYMKKHLDECLTIVREWN